MNIIRRNLAEKPGRSSTTIAFLKPNRWRQRLRRFNSYFDSVQSAIRIQSILQRPRPQRRQRAFLGSDGLPDSKPAKSAPAGPCGRYSRQGPHYPKRTHRPRYQTVYRFSDECGNRFEKHGFGFLGRKTIVTDVVRENNQTYRLGWTGAVQRRFQDGRRDA